MFCHFVSAVVNSVLQRKEHIVDSKRVIVHPYSKVQGIFPPGHDTSVPPTMIPAPVIIEDIAGSILQYIEESKDIKSKIERHLQQYHCTVHWPRKRGEPVTLKCALKQSQPDFVKLSKAWSQTVKQQMSEIFKQFSEMHVEVLQHVWSFVRSTPGAVSDNLFCDYEQKTSRVVLAGPASKVRKAAERLKTEAKEIAEKMDMEKRRATK